MNFTGIFQCSSASKKQKRIFFLFSLQFLNSVPSEYQEQNIFIVVLNRRNFYQSQKILQNLETPHFVMSQANQRKKYLTGHHVTSTHVVCRAPLASKFIRMPLITMPHSDGLILIVLVRPNLLKSSPTAVTAPSDCGVVIPDRPNLMIIFKFFIYSVFFCDQKRTVGLFGTGYL